MQDYLSASSNHAEIFFPSISSQIFKIPRSNKLQNPSNPSPVPFQALSSW